ncbi:hypothetical protein CRYUN_Cryun04dG0098500 [Craigia yunnanensis]
MFIEFLSVAKRKDSFESVVMDHLRKNGAYWGLTTLDLLGKLDTVNADEAISWIMKCQHKSCYASAGPFQQAIDVLDIDKVATCILPYMLSTKLFPLHWEMWGEVDTRFSYIAVCYLSILHCLDKINVEKAVSYILSCKNLDGGFGCTPGGESHAQQIFCGVGALAITGSLHHVYKDPLGWCECEWQVKSGGLNGRHEKLPDICYSWWVLSSLIMIERVHWIDKEKLVKFILDCQDVENGGISDRPDDVVDVFRTYC